LGSVYRCTDSTLHTSSQVEVVSRPCVEALAHAFIFGTFVASAVFFGTSNLEVGRCRLDL